MTSTSPARVGRPRRLRVATVITKLEGGAGVLALRGAQALDPAEYTITIVTGRGSPLLATAAAGGLDTMVEPTLRTAIDPPVDLVALRRLTALFASGDFDVVHTHTAKAGAVGRLAAHRAGVPKIVHTFHGFPFHPFQSAVRRTAYVSIERGLGRITDLTLCVGNGVAAEAVRRRLVTPDRVHTIGVAVDTEVTTRDPRSRLYARRALGVPREGPVVGAVGRLVYQKAPEDFVEALRVLGRTDVTGVWIGDGDLADQVRRLADRAVPGVRLILPGERSDIPELLPAFDVFALPSLYEGLPTAVIEAMVCGVPVVATAVNSVPDVVVPGRTGLLVPPRRPDLMAVAIRHLLDCPAEASRLAATARAWLDDRYTRSTLAEALRTAYGSLPSFG